MGPRETEEPGIAPNRKRPGVRDVAGMLGTGPPLQLGGELVI